MARPMKLSGKIWLWLGAALLAALFLGPAAAAEKQPPPPRVTNPLGMEFALIQPGSFMMGAPPSEPGFRSKEVQHKVFISRPFYMQTTEVTLAQWRAVMGMGFMGMHRGGGNLPVTQVSYYQVQRFLEVLNSRGLGRYRLPSEAEWEYSARAGSQTAYPWGDGISCQNAMYANNPEKRGDCVRYYQRRGLPTASPAPVKSFPPNDWGLYDMNGNLWEWVADWLGPYPKGPVSDPQGPTEGTWRVRRGGSWFSGPQMLRSANRNFAHPASKYNTLGFRLVKEIP
jgi:formylglycine-generating enzyme required for sulfatase activity